MGAAEADGRYRAFAVFVIVAAFCLTAAMLMRCSP
jgi:hypothetical protein